MRWRPSVPSHPPRPSGSPLRRASRSVPSGNDDASAFTDLRIDREVMRRPPGAAEAEAQAVAGGVPVLEGQGQVCDAGTTVLERQSKASLAFVDLPLKSEHPDA